STILLTTLYLLLTTGTAQSQSWQWGERGGSSDGTTGTGPDEYTKDITVDANGNLYVLSHGIGKNSLSLGNLAINTNFGAFDILLASFTCNGQLRWYKVIGCRREDYGYAIKVDKDGVYIVFKSALYSGTGTNDLHFDSDTTIYIANTGGQAKPYKDIFLAKYDTSGNFKWVVTPQPDTVSYPSNVGILTLDVDDQGLIHCLSILS